MKNSKVKTRSLKVQYDNWKDYDLGLKSHGYRGPKLVMESLARYLKSTAHVLDVGCGTGLAGRELQKRLPKCVITGMDFSDGMLNQAKKKRIYKKLVQSDLRKRLPFKNNCFDASACIGVFEYFKNIKRPLSELSRVSKNYVAFYILVTSPEGYEKHDRNVVLRALLSVGLVPVESFAFTAWHDCFALGFITKKIGVDKIKKAQSITYTFFPAVPTKTPL